MAISQPTPSDLSGCATEVASNFVADANNYDARLGNAVVVMASEAASEVTSLNTRISTASSSDSSTTTSLTTRVSTEESTRASADTSLTTRVSTEESTRASADTSLTTRVNADAVLFSLYAFREVTSGGDVGNIAGGLGNLGSDTTPILRGDAAESQEISWATGNTDIIACQTVLPSNFTGTALATLDLWVYSGATDAATFTVETSWDGGAVVSDTADDAATKSATIHKITATIAAADIPDTAQFVTIMLTPAAHGSDATQIVAARLNFSVA